MPTRTAAEASTTIAVGQNGRTGKIACRMFGVTAMTPAPKNSPTRSSAVRKRAGKVRPPKRGRGDSSDRSPLNCPRAPAAESTNLRTMPTVKTPMSARPYSAPEFIVVIISEAPTLANASTIPGPMSRSRPAKVDGAKAAPTVVWGVGADDMVELRFLAECVIGRDGRHQVCPKHPLRGHSVSILELWASHPYRTECARPP